jgi:nitrate/nitrite transporter NarK
MACLCLSGGFIYLMPYMRQVYHIPLQEALGLTNTQFGVLTSVFGAVAMITYFPGGWLADRISARKLITFSMLATGASGLYFASFPIYPVTIAIHALWGVTTILTFWAALIKATRNWGSHREQGRAFGILEGGRGVAELGASTTLLAVFALLGSGRLALSWVIMVYSALDILVGILAWYTLEEPTQEDAESTMDKIGLRQVLSVLKMPAVWLVSIVILAGYSSYWGTFYYAPYATDVLLMSVVVGGAIGVGRMWLRPVAPLAAGFLADRVGISKTVAWCFVIVIVSNCLFVATPNAPNLIAAVIANMAVATLVAFALRGIFYALLQEGGIPLSLTGTAAGVVSVLGYTPDFFMPLVGGVLMDKLPAGTGYKSLFGFIVVLGVCGLAAALGLHRMQNAVSTQ